MRRRLAIALTIPVAIGLIALGVYFLRPRTKTHTEVRLPAKPEAPPDLDRLRNAYSGGLDAVQRGDGVDAVRHLDSFTFRDRAVEVYRLYYLATAFQLMRDPGHARVTLARLASRSQDFALADDAGLNLAGLYSRVACWSNAGDAYAAVAVGSDSPAVSATARWAQVESRFFDRDIAGATTAARLIFIKTPRAPQAADALSFVRGLYGIAKDAPLPLSPDERLERAVCLLRDGDPQSAFDELSALEPAAPDALRNAVRLNIGLALNQMHRYADSNKVLEPLAGGSFEIAIPAIYNAWKNYRALSASINPIVTRTILQRRRVGSTKVEVGKGEKKRLVTKPRFVIVRKTSQRINLAKKAKKDAVDRLAAERLKDLLQIKAVAPTVRLEALNALVAMAAEKKQDAYVRDLVSEIVKIDPNQDPALQHFWDDAWAAWTRGDLNRAKQSFRFIADTYASPNVKRQSEYWYARTIERLGEKEEAALIYRQLASAPYEDVYALNAIARGAPRPAPPANPLRTNRPDWREIAEKAMPGELRLAYELTALNDMRDAQLEIRKNANLSNQRFADALMADLYNATDNVDLLYRTIRRAFPQLATVEQDSVPPYFVKMYYPIRYQDSILRDAKRFDVDPYLVMALILQESSYNARAKSAVGATGLMQLMPSTGKEIARKLHGRFYIANLENPDTNIELGTYHLQHMTQIFGGQVQLAVASYNAGQGNVLKWRRTARSTPMDEFLESIPFPETRNYVKRVTLLRSSYERITR